MVMTSDLEVVVMIFDLEVIVEMTFDLEVMGALLTLQTSLPRYA